MGISLLGGIVWHRANRWGAVASLVVSLVANFAIYALRNERLDHWDPNVFLIALLAGIAALIVVSLLTTPEPEAGSQSFFSRLHMPTETANPGHDRTTPAEAGKELLLVNLLHPLRGAHRAGFLKAYRVDLKGFSIGWALAIGLVLTTSWLFQTWLK
jgi:hypothetical protein